MINKNFISSILLTLTATLIFVTSCKPSLTKESNAIKTITSKLDTVTHDNIILIQNQIKEAHPNLEAYQKKVEDILGSDNSNFKLKNIFAKRSEERRVGKKCRYR